MSGVKGQKNPSVAERNRRNPYWLGKKRPAMSAANNPSWGGGGDKFWTSQALLRDDFICQECGYREPEIMEADHVIPKAVRPDLRRVLSNLQTLCPNCHRRKTNRERLSITTHRLSKAA